MKTARGTAIKSVVVAVVLALIAVAFPLAASANHGDAFLNVEPETQSLGVGGTATLTATLCEFTASPDRCASPVTNTDTQPVNVDFENEGDPNDPDQSTSRRSPDYSCDIMPGQSSCTISYTGLKTGDDDFRAWIDHDKTQTTVEADTLEARNENQNPGAGDPCNPSPTEPDCTDVVRVSWGPGAPAAVDCDDESRDLEPPQNTERETNPGDDPAAAEASETYRCTVTDQYGNPTNDADPNADDQQDIQIRGEVENGVNDPDAVDGASYDSPDYSCVAGTGGDPIFGQDEGVCEITVQQEEGEVGTAEICFWVGDSAACFDEPTDENAQANGTDTGNDLADQVEKTWEARSASQGGIDAEPETATNDPGQEHTIDVTTYDQFGDPAGGPTTVNFEFFQGSPTDTDGNTPESPDGTCTVPENETACAFTYSSSQQGTDLVCAWTNDMPSMQGTNQDGTCDGEGATDADDAAGRADAPSPANDDVDVVKKTWGQGGGGDGDGPTRVGSNVSIFHSNRPHAFKGRVTSARRACEVNRPIVIKKVRRGPDRVVARTKTGRRGRYFARHTRGRRGRYYAVAKYVQRQGGDLICTTARSSRIRVAR